MAIKAEDGCACPLICWTHCSLGPRFILLLCCILCKRNWKNQVWLRALWGSKLLRRREKKRVRLFFLLLCCQGRQWLPPSPGLPDVCVSRSLEVGERLPKYLGLALSWPSCRLLWSHCPCTAPVPGSAGSWLWGPQLSQKSTARKPQLLAPGFLLRIFPWRFEITYSPHYPPSLWLPSNESVSHLKCIFHNCSEVLEEEKLTALNSSSVLSSLWPLFVFYMKMINLFKKKPTKKLCHPWALLRKLSCSWN